MTDINLIIWTKKGIRTSRPTHQPKGSVQDLFKRALQNLADHRYTFRPPIAQLGAPERLKELGNVVDEADRKALTPPQSERLSRWKASLWDGMKQGRAEYEA